MGTLDGKVAIVTGAGRLRGIGRATALALAELGADLVVTGTGRDPARFPPDEQAIGWRDIESTAAQVRERGRRCLPVVADVASSADVKRTMSATLQEFGRVDILINNAAFARGPDRVPLDEQEEGFVRQRPAWHQRLVPAGWIDGDEVRRIEPRLSPNVRGAAYEAESAQVDSGRFTQALAIELAPHNIRVNAVCPGVIDTSRMDDLGRGETWTATIDQMIPLKRAASDEEVGKFVAYLCTPDASYLTGQSLNFDGGVVMW